MLNKINQNFEKLYSKKPKVFFSPGRVNLIGEHTDYNNGFVMPIAIDMGTFIAISARQDSTVNVYSENLGESTSFDLTKVNPKIENSWQNYIKGSLKTTLEYADSNKSFGADIYIYSNLPFGAGLSSSASLTTALAFAYSHINNLKLSKIQLAQIAQKVEHKYIGTNCGIMDQMACIFSTINAATCIDCQDYSFENIPFKLDNVCLLICDTNIKHNLAESAYNERRTVCENIARYLNIPSLRNLDNDKLKLVEKHFSSDESALAKHIYNENQRVLYATTAMKNKDWYRLGQLMYQSHYSLQHDYKVSSHELDYLVNLSTNFNGVFGARMTGGGFGGSTIHLIKEDITKEYIEYLTNNYYQKFKITPAIYISKACNGTHICQ